MNLVRRTGPPVAMYRPPSLDDQFGRMVESIFQNFIAPAAQAAALTREEGTVSPRIDVSENEQAFVVHAEMPGVKKEDVKVSIENNRVTIEAETIHEKEEQAGGNVIYTERCARKFRRSFVLPAEVDESAAEARLDDGILTLTLPRKQATAKQLTVQ